MKSTGLRAANGKAETMDTEIKKNPFGPDCPILEAVICHTAAVLAEVKKDFAAEALFEQW